MIEKLRCKTDLFKRDGFIRCVSLLQCARAQQDSFHAGGPELIRIGVASEGMGFPGQSRWLAKPGKRPPGRSLAADGRETPKVAEKLPGSRRSRDSYPL